MPILVTFLLGTYVRYCLAEEGLHTGALTTPICRLGIDIYLYHGILSPRAREIGIPDSIPICTDLV